MNKQIRLLFSTISVTVGVVICQSNFTLPTYAGGVDAPSMQHSGLHMMNNQNTKSQPSFDFDWKRWSQPYMKGDLICREMQGNTICLTSQAAKQMKWQIQ
jgi:hypothetical protein